MVPYHNGLCIATYGFRGHIFWFVIVLYTDKVDHTGGLDRNSRYLLHKTYVERIGEKNKPFQFPMGRYQRRKMKKSDSVQVITYYFGK